MEVGMFRSLKLDILPMMARDARVQFGRRARRPATREVPAVLGGPTMPEEVAPPSWAQLAPLLSTLLLPVGYAVADPSGMRALLRLAASGQPSASLAWLAFVLLALAPLALSALPWTRASQEDAALTMRAAVAWWRAGQREETTFAEPEWSESPVRTSRST
jgi:hypothetical protein